MTDLAAVCLIPGQDADRRLGARRDKPSLYKPRAAGRGSPAMAIRWRRRANNPIKTEVLIAGGGMVGMATAVALARGRDRLRAGGSRAGRRARIRRL